MTAGLTVGDFSRITHLSVKTLRHYHEVGLLEPATVNPSTGYRYYTGEQIPTAQVIRRLRDLEMPVGEVKGVLDAPDAPARNVLIAAHLGRLEAELAQTTAAVDSLRNLLRPPEGAPAIKHRSVPAARAAGVAAVVDRADILPWWQGALGELQATVRAQGLPVTGPSGGVYASELFQHDRGEATVFIPVEGSVRAIGRVTPVTIPAAELAIISHHGSLHDADLSYAT
ncbi:MAG: MerR family transcriptional regulator, partial [Streptosporangiaceae bacterium]